MSLLDDPEHWHKRANDALALAELLPAPKAEEMIKVADNYRALAMRAEWRARARLKLIDDAERPQYRLG